MATSTGRAHTGIFRRAIAAATSGRTGLGGGATGSGAAAAGAAAGASAAAGSTAALLLAAASSGASSPPIAARRSLERFSRCSGISVTRVGSSADQACGA
jgi:hypothetical protein